MKHTTIFLLALAIVAVAFVESQTIGIPKIGQHNVLDIVTFYFPAAIVVITTAIMLFMRFSFKEILWSVVAGTVCTISSFVFAPLTLLVEQWISTEDISGLGLLLIIFLMVIYLLALPAIALSIYFHSIENSLKKMQRY